MTSGLRLGDVVNAEIEQLERFGEAAEEYFHGLSEEIRKDFSASLEQILSGELAMFQQALNASTANSGYGQLGNLFGNLLGDVVGDFLPDNLFGDVSTAALKAVIRTVAVDVLRSGNVNPRRVLSSATRSSQTVLNRHTRNMSVGQESAEILAALQHGQRNL